MTHRSLLLRLVAVCSVAALLCSCSAEGRKKRVLAKADQYFTAGDYDKAEIEYKNALQIEGLNPEAIARLGIIYVDQGRVGYSYRYLRKANELRPDDLAVRLKLGYISLALGKYDEARDAANFVLERKPQDSDAPILLADSVFQPREVADARSRLQKLTASSGNAAAVSTAEGLLDLREKKLPSAEAHFKRAIELDPNYNLASSALGRLYWSQNDLDRAEKAFAKAAALSSSRSPIRLQHVQFNLQTGHTDAAKALLEEMVRQTPDFIPPFVLLANVALGEKKYDESSALLERVMVRDPENLEAMLLLAQARLAKGEKEKALALLEKAASVFPQAPQVHFQLGSAYLANGDMTSAAASFTHVVKLSPGFAPGVIALAQVNIQQGNLAPPIVSLKALLQQNPNAAEARLLLGDALRRTGNLDEALAQYRQVSEASSRNPPVQFLIGSVLQQQNKTVEARAAYAKALEASPEFLPALEQLVNLDVAEKQPAAAKARLAARLATHPKEAGSYFILANVHLSQNEKAEAEAALKKTIELQPDSPLPYLTLAQLYEEANELDKAIANLKTAALKAPKDAGPPLSLGMLQERQKNYAAAKESYERVLAINPKSSVALNNLAYLYAEPLGEVDRALDLAQKAREVLPNRGETADTLGWVLFKKGQFPRALSLLQEAAEKLPQNPDANFHAGMASYMMGNEAAARELLGRALDLSKDFAGADEARECLRILSIDPAKVAAEARTTLERAVGKRPNDPVALTRLGAIYEREGKADMALRSYEAALQATPGSVKATLGAVRIYRGRKETTKAVELAKVARQAAPTDADLARALGQLAYETGNFIWSLSLLQDAARKNSDDAELQYDLAEAYYSVGQVPAATGAFSRSLEINPTFTRATKARQALELIAASENPTAMSVKNADALLKTDPKNVRALMAQGASQEKSTNLVGAKEAYEKALTELPDFTPAQRRLALLYSRESDINPKAAEVASKARQAFPSDPEIAKALGIILYRQGNFGRASTLLQESFRSLSTDAEVAFYLGMAQSRQNDRSSSARSLQKALDLGLPKKLEAEARKALSTKS